MKREYFNYYIILMFNVLYMLYMYTVTLIISNR